LVRVHAHRNALGAHAHAHIAQNHRGLRRSQLADALLERRWRIAAAHRSGAAQDLGAVLALHADRRMRAAILRFGYERPDLVALETRVAIVRGERALREPLRPPERDTQRRELADVRRP